MLKAEIMIGTCYGEAVIAVEVLGLGPRPGTAWVRALHGLEPFTRHSHGGSSQNSTTVVLIPHLQDVRVENDTGKEPIDPQLLPAGLEVQTCLVDDLPRADWTSEIACAVCARLPEGGEP